MSLLHRSDNVFKVATDQDVQPGNAYTVTAYSPGGVLASDATAGAAVGFYNVTTLFTLYQGHGLAVDDRVMLGIDSTTFTVVAAVDGNDVTVLGTISGTTGDTLINLGADTGASGPNYDGSTVVIYSTPDITNVIDQSRVDLSETGGFEYWHRGLALWELTRGGDGEPVAVGVDVGASVLTSFGLNVKTYGATGNGVTDDTAAIQAALDAFQDNASGSTGGNGGELLFPRGVYIISAPLLVGSGVNIVGEGALASVIRASSSFSGAQMILFQKLSTQFANNGIGMRYIQVDGNSIDCHAIQVYKGYDAVTFDTVYVDHVGLTGSAFRFEPDPNDTSANGVSQTILLNNCYAIHGPLASTGSVYYFKHCQEITLTNCKGFGGYAVRTGNCDVFEFDGCRGVTVLGGAAAISQGNGVHVKATSRAAQGHVFYGMTLEAVGTAILVEGNVFAINYLTIGGTRKQEGAVTPAVTTGGFDLRNVTLATIDSSPGFTLVADANCNRINFHTELLSNFSDPTGVAYLDGVKVYADNSDETGNVASVFRQPLAIYTDDTAGPAINFGHATETDYWRMFWSRSGVNHGDNDFGFNLRYTNEADVEKHVWTVEAGASTQRFYVADTEVLTVASTGITVPAVTTTGNSTLGDASTDTTTNVGRMILRTIAVDPTSSATAGTIGEVVYSSSTAKFYGKHTTSASDTNWRLMGT